MAQQVTNLTQNTEYICQNTGRILGLAQCIKNCHCCKLQHRSSMQLGSSVAVALMWVGRGSSDSDSRLGTSICHGCSSKKRKKNHEDEDISIWTMNIFTMMK